MVRRAILDRDDAQAPEDQALPPSQPRIDLAQQHRPPWRGAGGRWLVWTGRAVVWAVILLVGFRGVLAIAEGSKPSGAAAGKAAASPTTFPVALADAYALEFGQAYLNFSPSTAAGRGRQLAHFIDVSTTKQAGWNGAGTQRLLSEEVAGTSVESGHAAVVTLLASISGGRMIELGVPIYATTRGMTVSGPPALLPAPAHVSPPARRPGSDPATASALRDQLPAFFQAYASGDRTTLARFAAPGVHLQSLGGSVSFAGIDSVYAPPGGATRSVIVSVTWELRSSASTSGAVQSAPAALQMNYQLTVIREGSSWDVRAIGAAPPPGQGPP